jgi:hypothetical protein
LQGGDKRLNAPTTTWRSLLRGKEEAVVGRWLDDILSGYAPETSAFLENKGNRFANPVGHTLREGTRAILRCLLEKASPEQICRHLDEMIRVRAIQDFTASEAVSFIFLLKRAVRQELAGEAPGLGAELAKFDAEVDQVALFAFDIYTRCRGQVYELRINEVKRNVSAILERTRRPGGDPAPVPDGLGTEPEKPNVLRNGDS